MRKSAIAVLLLVASLLVVSCGRTRVIPKSKFARIYADIFIADQWLSNNYELRNKADTMFFYDPIFERYGYTRDDYFKSVEHYLEDPAVYVKILTMAKKNINLEEKRLTEEIERENRRRENLAPDHHVANFLKLLQAFERFDKIELVPDDKGVYMPKSFPLDTIYEGPRVIVKTHRSSVRPVPVVKKEDASSTVGKISSKSVEEEIPVPLPKATSPRSGVPSKSGVTTREPRRPRSTSAIADSLIKLNVRKDAKTLKK